MKIITLLTLTTFMFAEPILTDIQNPKTNAEDILFIMEEINAILSSFNDFSCDYLGKDSFTYTLAGGIIEEDHIDIANIGDSNVFLFDSN